MYQLIFLLGLSLLTWTATVWAPYGLTEPINGAGFHRGMASLHDERIAMGHLGVLTPWFPEDLLTIAAAWIAGLAIAATLYVFAYDYATPARESRL